MEETTTVHEHLNRLKKELERLHSYTYEIGKAQEGVSQAKFVMAEVVRAAQTLASDHAALLNAIREDNADHLEKLKALSGTSFQALTGKVQEEVKTATDSLNNVAREIESNYSQYNTQLTGLLNDLSQVGERVVFLTEAIGKVDFPAKFEKLDTTVGPSIRERKTC
jgi:hypothetical protein